MLVFEKQESVLPVKTSVSYSHRFFCFRGDGWWDRWLSKHRTKVCVDKD